MPPHDEEFWLRILLVDPASGSGTSFSRLMWLHFVVKEHTRGSSSKTINLADILCSCKSHGCLDVLGALCSEMLRIQASKQDLERKLICTIFSPVKYTSRLCILHRLRKTTSPAGEIPSVPSSKYIRVNARSPRHGSFFFLFAVRPATLHPQPYTSTVIELLK